MMYELARLTGALGTVGAGLGDHVLLKFCGGLSIVEKSSLPLGALKMLRSKKVTWQMDCRALQNTFLERDIRDRNTPEMCTWDERKGRAEICITN